MDDIFIHFLNMGISASWLVLAVLVVRLLLRKAPKWIRGLLWVIVAVRLVLPGTFESVFSLIPSAETVSPQIMYDPEPTIQTGISVLNDAVNPVITSSFRPSPMTSANPLQIWIAVAGQVWLLGMVAMILYTAISYIRLRLRVRTAVKVRENIFESERVAEPFVLGMIRPRIYLPMGMDGEKAAHVIAHEKAHILRGDTWWKPLGFLLLTVHWYNPVMWLGYILLCRDIELACDEKVIARMGPADRADYSEALIACAVRRRQIAACPLAFGEVGVKARVKSVLNYKKPAFWIILVAIIASVAVAVCFLTDPKTPEQETTVKCPLSEIPQDYSLRQAAADGCLVMEDGSVKYGKSVWEAFYQKASDGKAASVRTVSRYNLGDPERYDPDYYETIVDEYPKTYVHDLEYDGKLYTYTWYEDGVKQERQYPYLLHFVEGPRTEDSTYERCERYVLTESADVTWDEIWKGMISSQLGAMIPHSTVYLDFTPKLSNADSVPLEPVEPGKVTVWYEYWIDGETMTADLPGAPDIRFRTDGLGMYMSKNGQEQLIHNGMTIHNAYFLDLTGDGVSELCMTSYFGSGLIDEYVSVYDAVNEIMYNLRNRGVNDYALTLKNDVLYVLMKDHGPGGTIAEGRILLVGSVYGDSMHLGFVSDELPVTNTLDADAITAAMTGETVNYYSGKGPDALLTETAFQILDAVESGDPVYKEGVLDRTTVYGLVSCEKYNLVDGEPVAVYSHTTPYTVTFRLASTGNVYVTQREEDIPQEYKTGLATLEEELKAKCLEKAKAERDELLSVYTPWGIYLKGKQIRFSSDQAQASMEWSWNEDHTKAPKEYARENFVYLWEDLPEQVVPEGFELPICLFLHQNSDPVGSPQLIWKIYREDGTVYSKSGTDYMTGSWLPMNDVALPDSPGTYYLEATIYWADFDIHMRYGVKLIIQ